jgi:probable F420-dependent oxidoreductase
MAIRFGYQLSSADESSPVEVAQRAEVAGFDVLLVSDHVGPGVAPMVTLAAIAQATERIRLGTFVLNNDMRNPVQLAWEAASLDRLSGGRFELGLGAGHTSHEYAATSITFDTPAVRKRRLMESVEVIRRLVDGESVTFAGEFFELVDAQIDAAVQARLPILVGGNGTALLEHAGAHADIVGLQGLGRTREDGHRHGVKWTSGWLDEQIEQVRSGAGARFDQVELNALVQIAEITDDRTAVLAKICERIEGVSLDEALETPYLLVGTVDQIVEKVVRGRERWGITYFVVRTLDEFEPVIRAVRALSPSDRG